MATVALITRQEFYDLGLPGEAVRGASNELIDAGILAASGTATSFLRKRYKPPFTYVGGEVKRVVANLAQYEILSRHGFRPGSGNEEIAEKRHDDALAWLKLAARGEVEADITDSSDDVDEEGPLASSDTPISFRFVTGKRRTAGPCCDDE